MADRHLRTRIVRAVGGARGRSPPSSAGPRSPPTRRSRSPASRSRPRASRSTVGDTVTWTNSDAQAHTATADDASWDSGTIAGSGGTGAVTFATAGTFPYHCKIHPAMTGTVTVEAAAPTTAPAAGATTPPTDTLAAETDPGSPGAWLAVLRSSPAGACPWWPSCGGWPPLARPPAGGRRLARLYGLERAQSGACRSRRPRLRSRSIAAACVAAAIALVVAATVAVAATRACRDRRFRVLADVDHDQCRGSGHVDEFRCRSPTRRPRRAAHSTPATSTRASRRRSGSPSRARTATSARPTRR